MSEKPLRAKTPYNYFYQEMFQEILQETQQDDSFLHNDDNGQIMVGSLTPVFYRIANQWKNLTDQDRQHYHELAAADKRRYMHEMAEWHRSNQAFGDELKTFWPRR